MKTTIVIVTFNAMPWLDRCLQNTTGFPVVVVDNASTDDTLIHIQNKYPKATVLPQQKNLGFGQGNNVGIAYALKQGAENVFLLNQDAYLVDDCLSRLVTIQQSNPEYGVLSPIHLNGAGDALDYNFKNFVKRSNHNIIDNLFLNSNKDNNILNIEFVNAAAWLVSKKCFLEVGGFNPYFFQYGEDREYINRLVYNNLKVGIVNNVFVKHDREQKDSIKKSEIIEILLTEVKLLDLKNQNSVEQYLGSLRKTMIKDILKFNFKEFQIKQNIYTHIKKNKQKINYYRSEIKSNKRNLFLEL